MAYPGRSCALALALVPACGFTGSGKLPADPDADDAPRDAMPDTPPDAPGTMFCDPGDARLRACYTFDDTLIDGSANANHAMSSGILPYTAGRTGRAVVTTSSVIRVPASTSLNVSALTIQISINPLTLPAVGLRAGLVDSTGYRMFVDSGGRIRCAINAGGIEEVTTTAAVPVAVWTRVACTYDGTTMRVWFDGVQKGAANFTATIAAVTGNLTIGQNEPSGENFAGAIDELRIWGAALVAP